MWRRWRPDGFKSSLEQINNIIGTGKPVIFIDRGVLKSLPLSTSRPFAYLFVQKIELKVGGVLEKLANFAHFLSKTNQ